MEGADSKRGLGDNPTSRGCCARGYRSRERHGSLRGCPSADTYDNPCSLSLSNSHPYSRAAHAHAYANTSPDTHACAAHAHANTSPDTHA